MIGNKPSDMNIINPDLNQFKIGVGPEINKKSVDFNISDPNNIEDIENCLYEIQDYIKT